MPVLHVDFQRQAGEAHVGFAITDLNGLSEKVKPVLLEILLGKHVDGSLNRLAE